jgi:hypothetical protein
LPVIYIVSTIVGGLKFIQNFNIFRVLQNLENEFAGLKEEMVCLVNMFMLLSLYSTGL